MEVHRACTCSLRRTCSCRGSRARTSSSCCSFSRRGIHCASTSSVSLVSRCCTCRGEHCASTSSSTPVSRFCTCRGVHCASTSPATIVFRFCTYCGGVHFAIDTYVPSNSGRGVHCASSDFNASCVIATTECSISSKCASSFHGSSHREFPSSS